MLVVEDDPAVADTLGDVLIEHGYTVTVVSNGCAALAALSLTHFHAVLTDLTMPRMGGCKLVLAMRRRHLRVPTIVVSARPETAKLADGLGVEGYLMKPFDMDELVDKIRCAIGAADRGKARRPSQADRQSVRKRASAAAWPVTRTRRPSSRTRPSAMA